MARNDRNRPRRGSPLRVKTVTELLNESYHIIRANAWIFGPLFGAQLIFLIHSWLWSPIPGHLHHNWTDNFKGLNSGWVATPLPAFLWSLLIGFSIIWLIMVVAIGTIALIMTQAAQVEAIERRPLHFGRLWQTTKKQWKEMVKLYGLMLLNILQIRRYFLSPYVLLDEKVDAQKAMARSSALSDRNPGGVWNIIGVFLLIAAVGIVPVIGGFASFVLGLFFSMAPALRYQELKRSYQPLKR